MNLAEEGRALKAAVAGDIFEAIPVPEGGESLLGLLVPLASYIQPWRPTGLKPQCCLTVLSGVVPWTFWVTQEKFTS